MFINWLYIITFKNASVKFKLVQTMEYA